MKGSSGILATCLVALLSVPFGVNAAPPRYDHVVIVMEENRTPGEIVGDVVNAPYISALASNGVSLGAMFAIEHPSQPNYLQLFSGSNQGVVDDNLPPNFSVTPTATYPFQTLNLAAELVAAGFTFAGFAEELEAAGTNDWADWDPHSATYPGIEYRRKHNPWANWVAKTSPIPANQLAAGVNRAFTQFPTNFNELPTVCFVIPNQLHDMHDGSRKQGDDWLRDNLHGYATWAVTNNSLLIVTWDEDDYNEDNQIPTVFYGAHLRTGSVVAGTWTLHNLLRTLEDMYGLGSHAGAAADVRAITGPFVADPSVTVRTFQQGVNGYAGAHDTQVWQQSPDATFGSAEDLVADLDTTSATAGHQVGQVLVRFDGFFGSGPGLVPTNALIHSAKLILQTPKTTSGTDDSDDTFRLHRMIIDWADNATWNSFGAGVSADNVEAAGAPSFSLVPDVDGGPAIFDVTRDIELFQNGTTNHGWVIRPSTGGTGDGWTLKSSEAATAALRPALEIVYSFSDTPYQMWTASHGLTGANANADADPDRDGADNLAEFAYNLDPNVADAHPVPPGGTHGKPAAQFDNEGGLEVRFIRRTGSTAAGLSYSVAFSDDLVTWSAGQFVSGQVIAPGWQLATFRDPDRQGKAHRFARVIIALQQ